MVHEESGMFGRGIGLKDGLAIGNFNGDEQVTGPKLCSC